MRKPIVDRSQVGVDLFEGQEMLHKNIQLLNIFPIITHPITEHATVQEALKYAEEATKEMNQIYVMTT